MPNLLPIICIEVSAFGSELAKVFSQIFTFPQSFTAPIRSRFEQHRAV